MGCGCMDTPGYGVKMQWMHGDPWVRGEDARRPGYGVWMHGDPWVRGEDAVDAWRPLGMDVDAWRPLGMGCGCMETPGYGMWMHGDPWVWGVDALGMG